jgi:hypothetical protein
MIDRWARVKVPQAFPNAEVIHLGTKERCRACRLALFSAIQLTAALLAGDLGLRAQMHRDLCRKERPTRRG